MSLSKIEQYAVDLAANAIESSADDDLDEEGVFPGGNDDGLHPDHEAALDLAQSIANGIRTNPSAAIVLACGWAGIKPE